MRMATLQMPGEVTGLISTARMKQIRGIGTTTKAGIARIIQTDLGLSKKESIMISLGRGMSKRRSIL